MATAVTCPSCGADAPAGTARWCGSCGAVLQPDAGSATETTPAVIRLDEAASEPLPEERPIPHRHRTGALLVVAAVVLSLLALQARQGGELADRGYTPRGDGARTGVVSLAAPGTPTEVAWRAALEGGGGWSRQQSAIDGDVVAVAGQDGIALHDREDGAVRWSRPDLAADATPTIAGDTVVLFDLAQPSGGLVTQDLAAARGRLLGLDLADGSTRWERNVDFGRPTVASHPAGVVVLDGSRAAALLDPLTGEDLWRTDTLENFSASVRGVFVGDVDDVMHLLVTRPAGIDPRGVPPELVTEHVIGVDATSGARRFEVAGGQEVLAGQPLALAGDTVVAVDADRLWRWDARTGQRLGVDPHGIGAPITAVTAAQDTAIVTDVDGNVIAFDADSGERRWGNRNPGDDPPIVTVAGDVVLLRTGDQLSILRLDTGDLRGTFELPADAEASAPDSASGGAFVVTVDGEAQLRTPGGATSTRWPTLTPAWPMPVHRDGAIGVVTAGETALFSAADGTLRWRLQTSSAPDSVEPSSLHGAVAIENLLVVSPPRQIRANPEDGLAAIDRDQAVFTWDRSDDDRAPTGPLTLAGDLVFLPVGSQIHGYDWSAGRRSFAARAEHPRGPVAAHPEYLVAATDPSLVDTDPGVGSTLIAIRRVDRTTAWEQTADACTAPTVSDDVVLVGTHEGVAAHDVHRGQRQWLRPLTRPACLDLAVSADTAVAVDGHRTLEAVSTSGAPLWTRDLGAAVVAAPTIAGDTVLVPLLDGTIVGIDLETGTEQWSFEIGAIPASSVAIADGQLLVLTRAGELVAVATS